MDTWCVAVLKHDTFSILISLPSRACDLARFFLLMHFTATCQSRFYNNNKKNHKHEYKQTKEGWRDVARRGAMIYLFMSAFEHNCKGAVTNQILPAELKLPDWLHDQ